MDPSICPPTLTHRCLMFVAENAPKFSSAVLTELPNCLLEDLLNYWSACDLEKLEEVYVEHGITTLPAWKNHIKKRPEYFRKYCASFQCETFSDNPKEIYIARHFQDMLAYLTYDGVDPDYVYHTCLHKLSYEKIITDSLCKSDYEGLMSQIKKIPTIQEAQKMAKYVRTLTLFGKQVAFLLTSPKLLTELTKTVQRLVLHIPRDNFYNEIKTVTCKFLQQGILEHVSLFHSMLCEENLLELLKLCAGQVTPNDVDSIESPVASCSDDSPQKTDNSQKTDLCGGKKNKVECQCSECISLNCDLTCVQPQAKLYGSLAVDSIPDCDVSELLPRLSQTYRQPYATPNNSQLPGDSEIDLFNEAVMPTTSSMSNVRRLFHPKNIKNTSVRCLSIISSGYKNLDLESVLTEVLSSWSTLKNFAIQFTWMQRKKVGGNGSLTNLLKDMISVGQLSELVIEETRDVMDNGTSPLDILEAVIHGNKRSTAMKSLKLKDLYSSNFVPLVPTTGIDYHGIVNLDLAKNLLSGRCFPALIYILQHDLSLQYLGIAGCGLTETDLIILFETIAEQNRLVSLDISDQAITEAALVNLNILIKNTTSLHKLVMVYCQLNSLFDKVSHQEFTDLISTSNLKCLNLSQNRLGRKAVDIMQTIIQVQKPIIKLLDIDISYNTISLTDITALAGILQDHMLSGQIQFRLNSLCITGNVSCRECSYSDINQLFQGVATDLHAENCDYTLLHADHVSQM